MIKIDNKSRTPDWGSTQFTEYIVNSDLQRFAIMIL